MHITGPECPGCNSLLEKGDDKLKAIFKALKAEFQDLHTCCVYRGEEEQNAAFRRGSSRKRFGESAHNSIPSKAMDLFQIDAKGEAVFDRKYYEKLYSRAKALGFKFVWGGNYITLRDSPHFQVK